MAARLPLLSSAWTVQCAVASMASGSPGGQRREDPVFSAPLRPCFACTLTPPGSTRSACRNSNWGALAWHTAADQMGQNRNDLLSQWNRRHPAADGSRALHGADWRNSATARWQPLLHGAKPAWITVQRQGQSREAMSCVGRCCGHIALPAPLHYYLNPLSGTVICACSSQLAAGAMGGKAVWAESVHFALQFS